MYYWNPQKHPRMSLAARAAQFAPFAALNGHEEAIAETARLTHEQITLDDDQIRTLDMRLRQLADQLADRPQVTVTYFVKDPRKQGGAYRQHTGTIRRIEPLEAIIIFHDGTKISLPSITQISTT